jgi:hypothetical protein
LSFGAEGAEELRHRHALLELHPIHPHGSCSLKRRHKSTPFSGSLRDPAETHF